MNNLPSTLVDVLALKLAHVPELTRKLMVYANITTTNLGPKIYPDR